MAGDPQHGDAQTSADGNKAAPNEGTEPAAEHEDRPMSGFTNRSYGDGFADVYDRWYADVSPVAETVQLLIELAPTGDVLELGVGTGRLAVPLARAIDPRRVWGIDASRLMLNLLAEKDDEGQVVVIEGDMIDDLPDVSFSLVFAAYNTFFNLPSEDAQRRSFAAVADRLTDGGRFVIEAYVPPEPFPQHDEVGLRSMGVDEVVLAVTRHEPELQRASGQFIEIRDGELPRLRPWSVRYTTPEQLDEMALAAGLGLEHRWEDVTRRAFSSTSERHVSVYRLGTP